MAVLDFEVPVVELKKRIDTIKMRQKGIDEGIVKELLRLERQYEKLTKKIYSKLSRWQIVQLARHPDRPYTMDYIKRIVDDFVEFHGDRLYRDDPAIVAGFGRIDRRRVCIIGHQKGRTSAQKIKRNFGMPQPEGYRKAQRVMRLAERFRIPVITLIDTPGAFPGIDAEEHGQAAAIAESISTMCTLKVPIVSVVIGEGGSGGALALGVGDVVMMMEYAIYSVISPEACSSILFHVPTETETAAENLKLTSRDLFELGIIDKIIPEPPGGAHMDYDLAAERLKESILNSISNLQSIDFCGLLDMRYKKFREMGSL